jgi:tetratricopeptide (TPR) repeat protein
MALFGFNKQKVLSSAEKYVQQGKLQNAIAEYDKVLKNDPKDLTVANTVGDLYSRIGESDKATECFKTVGDAYASQGFTVKAIAMYKKISKLKPSLESVLKLAELYTQQGLFNDARAQYLQVAEEFLKSGELDNAVRIFQKILEMDPENTTMRLKLAEVYVRLGKKTEAWQIFSAAAETMRSKGSLTGADEILTRMLTLDPGNAYALLMQGKNLLESGDAEGAIGVLTKVADLDSNPQGLKDLLKAYLQAGRLSDAGTIAGKLLTVHNDLSAISDFADALMQAGQYESALQVYDDNAERLLAEDPEKILDHLHGIIGHVRDNPASLEKLLALFNKAGENTHTTEVTELLAHASVQAGDFVRARDLYQSLSQREPDNTMHLQNYEQMLARLGGTTGARKLITPEEAVVIVDELEATAPSVHQHYSDEVSLAVRSALTDAELFISYNMPAKALGPLVAALPQAPTDLRLNQRLAALHTRAARCRPSIPMQDIRRKPRVTANSRTALRNAPPGPPRLPLAKKFRCRTGCQKKPWRRKTSRSHTMALRRNSRLRKLRERKSRRPKSPRPGPRRRPMKWPRLARTPQRQKLKRSRYPQRRAKLRPMRSIFPRNGKTRSRLKPTLRSNRRRKTRSPSPRKRLRSPATKRSTRPSTRFASTLRKACPNRPGPRWPSCRRRRQMMPA